MNSLGLAESIERLQAKQGDLQAELDKVLKVAQNLEQKQRLKLRHMIDKHESHSNRNEDKDGDDDDDDDDDDDELIEFQQIENELRITELNRQLSNLQETLRIRLYKRLLSNATNRGKNSDQIDGGKKGPEMIRRGSQQTDESSPPSSSCSDEPVTTSSTSASDLTNFQMAKKSTTSTTTTTHSAKEQSFHSTNGNSAMPIEAITQPPSCNQAPCQTSHDQPRNTEQAASVQNHTATPGLNSIASSVSSRTQFSLTAQMQSDLNGAPGYEHHYENNSYNLNDDLHAGPSKSSYMSCHQYGNDSMTLREAIPSDMANLYQSFNYTISPSGNYRNNSANSDLERIDEDDEDDQDEDECDDSDRSGTIQEKKLSQARQTYTQNNGRHAIYPMNQETSATSEAPYRAADNSMKQPNQNNGTKSGLISQRNTACNPSHVNGTTRPGCEETREEALALVLNTKPVKRSSHNRPLTMYLSKPNEEIDLLEHIQNLGHDLNLISDCLSITQTSAQGSLKKCCLNNNKKWLKRYFYFGRLTKTLCYYENEAAFTSKPFEPKSCIAFDEIRDVYVDHKLSGFGENDGASRRKRYVFVLVTDTRKYYLASSRPETMRVWIDILYTAAQANDYFQELEDCLADGVIESSSSSCHP